MKIMWQNLCGSSGHTQQAFGVVSVWTAPLQVEGKEVDCLELPLNLNCDLVMLGVTGKPWGFKNGEPHGLPTV